MVTILSLLAIVALVLVFFWPRDEWLLAPFAVLGAVVFVAAHFYLRPRFSGAGLLLVAGGAIVRGLAARTSSPTFVSALSCLCLLLVAQSAFQLDDAYYYRETKLPAEALVTWSLGEIIADAGLRVNFETDDTPLLAIALATWTTFESPQIPVHSCIFVALIVSVAMLLAKTLFTNADRSWASIVACVVVIVGGLAWLAPAIAIRLASVALLAIGALTLLPVLSGLTRSRFASPSVLVPLTVFISLASFLGEPAAIPLALTLWALTLGAWNERKNFATLCWLGACLAYPVAIATSLESALALAAAGLTFVGVELLADPTKDGRAMWLPLSVLAAVSLTISHPAVLWVWSLGTCVLILVYHFRSGAERESAPLTIVAKCVALLSAMSVFSVR